MARVKIGNVFPSNEYLLARCAPAGYGFGEDTKQYITIAEIDNAYTSGFYWVSCPGTFINGQLFNFGLLRVSGMGSIHCIQELFPLGLDVVLIRRCHEGTWSAGWGVNTWESTTTLGGA